MDRSRISGYVGTAARADGGARVRLPVRAFRRVPADASRTARPLRRSGACAPSPRGGDGLRAGQHAGPLALLQRRAIHAAAVQHRDQISGADLSVPVPADSRGAGPPPAPRHLLRGSVLCLRGLGARDVPGRRTRSRHTRARPSRALGRLPASRPERSGPDGRPVRRLLCTGSVAAPSVRADGGDHLRHLDSLARQDTAARWGLRGERLMREAIFVTGGSGFVGRHLVPLLARSRRVFALRRPGSQLGSAGVGVISAGVISIEGDLANTELYAHALAECSMVVHLAAATGKRPATEYFKVNTEGTTRLLQACRAAGVPRFVFMSTIAATFPDRRHYPYAESKARAENAVRMSGLAHVIVRPTIVLGSGAPAWTGLRALTRGAFIIVPGTGRAVMQPIDVGDLAAGVAQIVERFPLSDTIVELGGPEPVTVETLLRGISRRRGGSNPRVVHVPLGPVVRLLTVLEPLLLPLLPVTAGQLSAFCYDSTARLHAPGLGPAPAKRVEAMLDESGLETPGNPEDRL